MEKLKTMYTPPQQKFIDEFAEVIKQLSECEIIFKKSDETHSVKTFADNMRLLAKELIKESKVEKSDFLEKQDGIYNCEKILNDCKFILNLIQNHNFNANSEFPLGFLLFSRLKIVV